MGTAEELFDVLTDLDALASDQEGRLKEFVTQYGEYDRGDAAAQIVDRFFGNRGDAR